MLFNPDRNKQLENIQAGIEEISGDLESHENKCKDCADNRPCNFGWSLINERLIYVCVQKFLTNGGTR
jgi:hypothetical protein